jgi:transposase
VPKLEEARKGEIRMFFLDAAHFIHGAYLSVLWSFKRIFVRANSGRSRLNILGAVDAVSNRMIHLANTTTINAWSLAELFRKLREEHPTQPITLVLDNAKYQRCHLTQSAANMLGIELLFLPPYSPNLNLIERVWKFLRKKCLNAKYYSSFTEFVDGIQNCIQKFEGAFRDELDSLLSWNFQTLPKVV